MKTEKFEVTGMTCASCVAHVEKSVSKLEGIQTVQVNLLTNSMTVSYDETALNNDIIEKSVENAGYEAHLKSENTSTATNTKKIDHVQLEQDEMKNRWWISLAFLVPLLYLSMGRMFGLPLPAVFFGHENALAFAFTQFLLTLPIAFVNKKYFTGGFKSLFKAAPNMDSLIAIGSSAAIVYGVFAIFRIGYGLGHGDMDTVMQFSHDLYFESGATILTLITLGKYLEARSKSRTSDAISRLVDLAPKTAVVIRDGIEVEIPVEELKIGDVVVVKSGQNVPVDGLILSGNGNLDESALTGESMPVFKEVGQSVMSASMNKTGYFTFRATKVGKDTTLSQIIRLVEEASASKAPISKMADRISSVFVPVVIAIAIVSTIVWLLLGYPFDFALSIGIAVLVISCPCALGLATPVAIMVGTGKGAEHGMLIKSAESLETAHKINTVVLDKTGTLTEGKPRVTDIIAGGNYTENELLQIACSLEKASEHPLAEAILVEAEKRKILFQNVTDFETIPGRGIKARIEKAQYFAGNVQLMNELSIHSEDFLSLSEQMAGQGKTPLLIAKENAVIGLIAVADVLKPSSKLAVSELQKMGMEVVMLTGDHRKTAQYIQSLLGISSVISEVLPQDKEKEISRLQSEGKKVAMVGDGINDAPALMRADLGIAIGAGTDIAIESADVVLMRNDLMDVVSTLQLSKSVISNIKQNLFWAFFYNVIGIPLAAGVFYIILGWKLNPMFAAAAMSFSSVTVVLNALRLLRFKPKFNTKPET
ncbi:MAG: heavy metal translocating P-type ATPase [Paludibacter sp.]